MSLEHLYQLFLQSDGICTDSRLASPGMIFFALRGDNFNGNTYASAALEGGCKVAVVDDPEIEAEEEKLFRVDDVLTTMQNLASHHRKQLGIPVIAITGTNGKTTTKELTQAVLSTKYRVLATKGNLNNHIGVPLTLLRLKDEEMAIIEMGANHKGEIDTLCRIADPNVGLITNVGFAHLEGFGSPEGVVEAKTELYRYLEKKNGTIFINGTADALNSVASSMNLDKVYYMDGDKPLCEGNAEVGPVFLKLIIRFMAGGTYRVSTRLTGAYNLENILAAACIGKYFSVPEQDIISAVEAYTPSNNRSQVLETKTNHIILDAYNANPTSMTGAIKNFLGLASDSKLMILGDMLELGPYAAGEHQKILRLIAGKSQIRVMLVGPEFMKAAKDLPFPAFYVVEDIIEHLRRNPVSNQLILLKGSRGIRLEKTLEVL